jgi:hypothetical protein
VFSPLLLVSNGNLSEKTQGAVDEPIGHLTHLTITEDDLREGSEVFQMVYEYGEISPAAGNYLIHENELGILVAFVYDDVEDLNRDWAFAEQDNLDALKREESEV